MNNFQPFMDAQTASTSSVSVTLTPTMGIPLKPPKEWFDLPEPDQPTPLTFDSSGQVYGHLALWDSCHRGLINGTFSECVQPPRSLIDYGAFHLGEIETEEGDMVPVGKMVYATDHAPLTAGLESATRFYDNTGAVGAFVRAKNGNLGIWLSGVVRSDITPEGLRDLRANPPSGDWRGFNHNLELIASLSVPVPGYEVPRAQLALAASAGGEMEVAVLILPGYTTEIREPESVFDRKMFIRKRKALAASIAIEEPLTAAVLSAKKRKSLSTRDFAIPESRSYPIHDKAHARNALARASGKPEEGRVRRAVCRRYPDMGECSKS